MDGDHQCKSPTERRVHVRISTVLVLQALEVVDRLALALQKLVSFGVDVSPRLAFAAFDEVMIVCSEGQLHKITRS